MTKVFRLVDKRTVVGSEFVLFDKDKFVFIMMSEDSIHYDQSRSYDGLQQDLIVDIHENYEEIFSMEIDDLIEGIKKNFFSYIKSLDFSLGYMPGPKFENNLIMKVYGEEGIYQDFELHCGNLHSNILELLYGLRARFLTCLRNKHKLINKSN